MKRYKKLFAVILSLALILCSTMPVTALAEEVNVPREFYSVTAEDPEWAEFETTAAMRAAVHLEESVFDDLPTAEVLRAVLEYPLIGEILCFNSLQEGIERTQEHCTALRVFLKRDDAYAVLRDAIDRNNQRRIKANLSDVDLAMTPTFLEKLTMHEGFAVEAIDYKTRQNETQGYATVYTPRGSAVSVKTRAEASAADIARTDEYYKNKYPKATFVSSSSLRYNCHSYAWYSTSTRNPYWMDDPSPYMEDGSYTKVTRTSQARKMYYSMPNSGTPVHSAIIYDVEGDSPGKTTVISKWGEAPVMIHNARYGPYTGMISLWK